MNTSHVTPLEQQQIRASGDRGSTFWHRVRFRLVQTIAAQAGVDTVLDIGAGSGLLGDWLLARQPLLHYQFEEQSPVLDRALGDRFGDHRRNPAVAPVPATTLITMLDVLEHIDDDQAALRSIHDRMEPGARLLLTVPAFQWAYTSWDEQLGHHRRYSRSQLLRCAREAGLHVESSAYLFPELLPLIAVRKLRRSTREHADFPTLPRVVDRAAETVSDLTTRLRRFWPAGTSVMAVVTKLP